MIAYADLLPSRTLIAKVCWIEPGAPPSDNPLPSDFLMYFSNYVACHTGLMLISDLWALNMHLTPFPTCLKYLFSHSLWLWIFRSEPALPPGNRMKSHVVIASLGWKPPRAMWQVSNKCYILEARLLEYKIIVQHKHIPSSDASCV